MRTHTCHSGSWLQSVDSSSVSGMGRQQPASGVVPALLCGFCCLASASNTLTSSFGLSSLISCSGCMLHEGKKLLAEARRRCTVTRTAAACWSLAPTCVLSSLTKFSFKAFSARRRRACVLGEAASIQRLRSRLWSAGGHHVRPGPQAHVVTCMMCFSDERQLPWSVAQDEQTPSQDKQWSLFVEPHLLCLGAHQTEIKNAQNSRKHVMHVEQAAVATPTVCTRFIFINVWVRVEVFPPVLAHS